MPSMRPRPKSDMAATRPATYGHTVLCPWPHHMGGDFIEMPLRERFTSLHGFYATAFHELTHWSEVRLGWEGTYAMGELVAEIAGCFVCAQIGIPNSDDLSNHTSYLAHWLRDLEDDPRAILRAASQASKAAKFILSFSRKAEEQPVEEIEHATWAELTLEDAAKEAAGNWQDFHCFVWFRDKELVDADQWSIVYLQIVIRGCLISPTPTSSPENWNNSLRARTPMSSSRAILIGRLVGLLASASVSWDGRSLLLSRRITK